MPLLIKSSFSPATILVGCEGGVVISRGEGANLLEIVPRPLPPSR